MYIGFKKKAAGWLPFFNEEIGNICLEEQHVNRAHPTRFLGSPIFTIIKLASPLVLSKDKVRLLRQQNEFTLCRCSTVSNFKKTHRCAFSVGRETKQRLSRVIWACEREETPKAEY